jgi:hypothetical protein
MPEEVPQRPDAVLYHQSYKFGGTIFERVKSIQDRLGPVLGGTVHSVDATGGWWLARLDFEQQLLFPKWHPLSGTQRYTWTDVEPGLKYGVLRDEARA